MTEAVNFVNIDPSPSPDTVGYRMYFEPTGTPVITVREAAALGNAEHSPYASLSNESKQDLSKVPEIANLDGEYDILVTAIDDANRESLSGFSVIAVPFDFVPPEAPVGVSFSVA